VEIEIAMIGNILNQFSFSDRLVLMASSLQRPQSLEISRSWNMGENSHLISPTMEWEIPADI